MFFQLVEILYFCSVVLVCFAMYNIAEIVRGRGRSNLKKMEQGKFDKVLGDNKKAGSSEECKSKKKSVSHLKRKYKPESQEFDVNLQFEDEKINPARTSESETYDNYSEESSSSDPSFHYKNITVHSEDETSYEKVLEAEYSRTFKSGTNQFAPCKMFMQQQVPESTGLTHTNKKSRLAYKGASTHQQISYYKNNAVDLHFIEDCQENYQMPKEDLKCFQAADSYDGEFCSTTSQSETESSVVSNDSVNEQNVTKNSARETFNKKIKNVPASRRATLKYSLSDESSILGSEIDDDSKEKFSNVKTETKLPEQAFDCVRPHTTDGIYLQGGKNRSQGSLYTDFKTPLPYVKKKETSKKKHSRSRSRKSSTDESNEDYDVKLANATKVRSFSTNQRNVYSSVSSRENSSDSSDDDKLSNYTSPKIKLEEINPINKHDDTSDNDATNLFLREYPIQNSVCSAAKTPRSTKLLEVQRRKLVIEKSNKDCDITCSSPRIVKLPDFYQNSHPRSPNSEKNDSMESLDEEKREKEKSSEYDTFDYVNFLRNVYTQKTGDIEEKVEDHRSKSESPKPSWTGLPINTISQSKNTTSLQSPSFYWQDSPFQTLDNPWNLPSAQSSWKPSWSEPLPMNQRPRSRTAGSFSKSQQSAFTDRLMSPCSPSQSQNAYLLSHSFDMQALLQTPNSSQNSLLSYRDCRQSWSEPLRMNQKLPSRNSSPMWKPPQSLSTDPSKLKEAWSSAYRPYSNSKSMLRLRELPSYDVESIMAENFGVGLIDTHCHLDFLFKRLPFEGTYAKFRLVNEKSYPHCYEGCVAIFCNPATFFQATLWGNLLEENGIWGAFGCHPNNAEMYNDFVEDTLKIALKHPKVRALGEIGLDYSRQGYNKEKQVEAFRRQIKLAKERNLPLVIHCRNAHEDCLKIMKADLPREYFIHRHCFTGDWEEAQQWLEAFPNLFFGFTALVTFPSAVITHEVVKFLPLSKLLLETDSPYFYPRMIDKFGEEKNLCHPGMVIHVAAQIAALRPWNTLIEILTRVRENTKKMYNI